MSLPRTGNIKGRIVALLCGLLTVLLLLEGALRVVGHVTHHLEARSDAPALHGQYTILCLGDSFTAGHFSVRETVPRALGKLLRRRIKRNDVFVVNKGASGHNTFQIRRRLPEYVKQYRPSMVLLLAGGANRWDLYGYYRYFEKDSLLSAEKDLLYRIRIFKLAKLLYLGVTAKLDDSRHPGEAVFNAPEISIRAPAGSKTGATAGHLNTARAYFQAQDHRNARRHFELALHANPQSVESHLALARLTEGPQQFDESIGHPFRCALLRPSPSRFYGLVCPDCARTGAFIISPDTAARRAPRPATMRFPNSHQLLRSHQPQQKFQTHGFLLKSLFLTSK